MIYETLAGQLSPGTLVFLAGAIAGASSNIQMVFSTFSSIADQALFLTDLLTFFASAARRSFKTGRLAWRRAPFERGSSSAMYPSPIPALPGWS